MYLGLPATWAEVEGAERQTGKPFHHSGAVPVTKDSFQIATLTCSTKLTQNGETSCFLPACSSSGHVTPRPPPSAVLLSVDLLGLLNWRSHPKDLDQILQRLMEVEGGEIVKVSAMLTAAC